MHMASRLARATWKARPTHMSVPYAITRARTGQHNGRIISAAVRSHLALWHLVAHRSASTPLPFAIASVAMADIKVPTRVAANIAKYRTIDHPVYIDVDEVGADPCNRMGSAPNIMIVHKVLAPSFKKDGFDPSKAPIGVCRSFGANTDLVARLQQHNGKFSTSLYPAIKADKMTYGSLGSTHVNITGRIFKEALRAVGAVGCMSNERPDPRPPPLLPPCA